VIYEDLSCTAVSIAEVTKASISVYPNPARESVIVTSSSQILSVVITDEHGRVVMNQPCGNSSATLSTDKLANGIYFIQVVTAEGSSFNKLIKQ
jgi:hypothetical protein